MAGSLFAVIGAGGRSGVVNLDGHSAVSGGFEAGYIFKANGNVYTDEDTVENQIDAGTNDWLDITPPPGYEIRATVNSGIVHNGDSTGTWLSLGSDRRWVTQTNMDLTIEIRFDGGAVLASANYVMS